MGNGPGIIDNRKGEIDHEKSIGKIYNWNLTWENGYWETGKWKMDHDK